MLKAGHILKDRYEIERHLGKGGMGSVYLATDRTFGSKVALKETIVQGGGLEEAFEREARVLNKLRHGAIPVVFDYFIEDDGRFLVMQYIPGDDLSTLLERTKKPFEVDRVLEWADQLLDALAYLHSQVPPIIHRDIKPQNLKLTDRGDIVLLDFGLSKAATGGEAQGVSIAGYTPSYAPLEQIEGSGTDARTDLFSLAATLYHLLTAVKPADVLRRVAIRTRDPLAPLHSLNSAVSPQVSEVLMSALALHAEDRPESALAMRTALRGAAFDDLLALADGFDSRENSHPAPAAGPAVAPAAEPVSSFAAAASDVATGELPTVVLPQSYSTAEPATPAEPVAPSELPTLVGSLPQMAQQASAPPTLPAPRPRNTKPPSTVSLVYETVTLDAAGRGDRTKLRGKQYFESAGEGASIAMVAVPAGAFTLGSPEDEDGRDESEGPALRVEVERLFVSRSPITQAQWRAVATALPRVRIDLPADPSRFKGDDRPVETVSWLEAREFCERLSENAGREYRLPSEAEWEYACRAGTETPFAFGDSLTIEVANVDGSFAYGDVAAADGRTESTPVESCGVANRFGLYDVHGNVWEWTEDRWHETLDGAPSDGSAWLEGGEPTVRVVRGGSWRSIPHDARSAKRFSYLEAGRRDDVSFRIVMAPAEG
jgi:formylglycine-generating enzyme required for sulfatase activity/tRNA A-37 threonylcarbamoyl transferase component Bud32